MLIEQGGEGESVQVGVDLPQQPLLHQLRQLKLKKGKSKLKN
jgi:hypothetical protein